MKISALLVTSLHFYTDNVAAATTLHKKYAQNAKCDT